MIQNRIFFKQPLLCIGLLMPIGLLLTEMPFWVGGNTLFWLIWKGVIEVFSVARPPRWVTNLLSVLFLVLVVYFEKTIFGYQQATIFLVMLSALKILEYSNERDHLFLILLGFFLCGSVFLYSADIYVLFPTFFAVICLWTSLAYKLPWSDHMFLVIRSLPLTVFLFFFFPRFENNRGIPGLGSSNAGLTGFSDNLNPGQFSEIVKDRRRTFQVEFSNSESQILTTDQYWKGQVLTLSNGLEWTKKDIESSQRNKFENDIPAKNPDYKLTLEPHFNRWLYSLENTNKIILDGYQISKNIEGIFLSRQIIDNKRTYLGFLLTPSMEAATSRYLQHPSLPLAVIKWIEPLQKFSSRDDKAKALLKKYEQDGFRYSLQPGDYSGNSALEEFLLNRKKGFCEHYAAATATLLRALNVPTRVVLGFQGGKHNTLGNFWSFSNADAHAWLEYLNDQNMWTRLDPTAVVAPERLMYGGEFFADLPEELIGTQASQKLFQQKLMGHMAWWDALTLYMENLNYKINLFLIEFDFQKQQEIIYNLPWSLLSFLISLGVFAIFLSLSFIRRNRVAIKWNAFYLQKLSLWVKKKYSCPLLPHEGPWAWYQRWSCFLTADEERKITADFIKCYIESEYQNNLSQTQQIQKMKQLWQKLQNN